MPWQIRCGSQARIKRTSAGLHHLGLARSTFQQIRTPDIADKNEIPSKKRDGLIRTTTDVGDEITYVLRRVTGSEQGLELDIPHAKHIAMLEKSGIGVTLRPFKLPIRATLFR